MEGDKDNLKEDIKEIGKQKENEYKMVVGSYTIIYPWTVVIIHLNAFLTNLAMFASFRFYNLTY